MCCSVAAIMEDLIDSGFADRIAGLEEGISSQALT